MDMLDDADHAAWTLLYNSGFCYYGCWVLQPGLGWTRSYRLDSCQEVIRAYHQVRDRLRCCLGRTKTSAGRQFLRFLDNRLACTELHVQALEQLVALHNVCDDQAPGKLTDDQRRQVHDRCQAAREFAEAYMKLHAEAIADRGGEGTLISYYRTIPRYIEHVRNYFCGEQPPQDDRAKGADEPPPPVRR